MTGFLKQLGRMAALVVVAGLCSALLLRYSPGALVDERQMDQRLSENSLAALRAERAANANVGANLLRYLRGLPGGDLGYSTSRNAPIAELIGDAAPETLRELAVGLIGGWLLGLGFAIPAGRFRQAWAYEAASVLAAGLLLSLPAALLAYFCFAAGAQVEIVLVLVLTPRIFQFARNLLVQAYGSAHVAMARARGIGEMRILAAHVIPAAGPQLLALVAASASMAIGAAIPIEAICDVPGLGRLAWQAAMARDLPLLVNLTMLVALATTIALAASEELAHNGTQREAARAR
ncbi:MAG TPA: ABC transporter permease subunit [Bryobacteraceae bacterium]|nr:ABC transporter permease subunit [Bryobacteraceae bacterium]